MYELPERPLGIRTLLNDESERLTKLHGREYTVDHCVTCAGKRTLKWWNPDDLAAFVDEPRVAVYECRCIDQWVMYRYFLHSGIGLHYQKLGWYDAMGGVPRNTLDVVTSCVDELDSWIRYGRGWFFHGKPGTGKTLMATLILKRALALGYEGHFTTFNEMLDAVKESWKSPDERAWFLRRISNVGVLVIDDPGREHSGASWTTSTLDEILRHRIAGLKPTIISTNETPESFVKRYGENIGSLIVERTVQHEVLGTDYRDTARKRLDAERDMGIQRPIQVD
jgi:DNA replication protein DnaC